MKGEGPLESGAGADFVQCGETAGPAVVQKVRDADPAMCDVMCVDNE